jgi:hypothetical protein
MKMIAAVTLMATTMVVLGCSEKNNAPEQGQNGSQKPKTVVVNKGMSKEEEEKLNERLAELEEEVNDQADKEQPTQETEGAEDAVLSAAQDYYAAAADGHYLETYSELDSDAQSQFTEDEWVAANGALGSDAASYSVDSVRMVDDSTAEVYLTITASDGSSSERVTRFVLENGSWKHELTQEEYDLFANATDSGASASASASAAATANADANTKHVKIIITSNKPADVSINDDSLNWFVTEEIVGTKTYERDIRENSGLSVSATTEAFRAETTIEVYENGTLVAQDTDSNGFAVVNY